MQAARQAAMAHRAALSSAPEWKPAPRPASIATPAKPITRPRMRERSGRSLNQAQATSAPNIGTVALITAASPLLSVSRPKAKKAKGRPEFRMPMPSAGFQCCLNAGHWPRRNSSGSRNSIAIATRTAAVGSAPNSAAPMRMNRKEAPHSAPSSTRSGSQARLAGLGFAVALAVRSGGGLAVHSPSLTVRLPVPAAPSCARVRRRSR